MCKFQSHCAIRPTIPARLIVFIACATIVLGVDPPPPDEKDIKVWDPEMPMLDNPVKDYVVKGNERVMDKKNHWQSPIVNHDLKIVMCSIPKCGSTPLRQLLRRVVPNSGDWQQRNGAHYWVHGKLPHFDTMTPSEVNKVLQDPEYRKVAIIRHPVERVLSGYLDKILGGGYNGEENWGKKYYHRDNMTFTEFVDIVTKERACDEEFQTGRKFSGLNEHWQCLYCFCGLRELRDYFEIYTMEDAPELIYDMVQSGHLPEKFVKDGYGSSKDKSLFLYDTLGAEGLPMSTEGKTADLIHRYYTPRLLALIKERYRRDMQFFSLDPDRYDYVFDETKPRP